MACTRRAIPRYCAQRSPALKIKVLVVDASVAAKWFIPQEHSRFADSVLDTVLVEHGCVPALFRWEIQNLLLAAERADRLTAQDVDDAMETLRDLPITVDRVHERLFVGNELRLARHYDLTAYDAAYLALALHHGAVLATSDAELCRAAKDLGLDLFSY